MWSGWSSLQLSVEIVANPQHVFASVGRVPLLPEATAQAA